jgi:hypothetical protein
MNPTPHSGCLFSANNSMAFTKVSMRAGSTGKSSRFGSRDWTAVSLVSCSLLVPLVPCPVLRPVSISLAAIFIGEFGIFAPSRK